MNPNKPLNPDALLDDYLDGLLSEAEMRAFEAKIFATEDLKEDFEDALMLKSAWKTLPTYKAPAPVFHQVMKRVDADIKEKRALLWQNRLNSLLFPGWKPAFAAATFVLGMGIWQMRQQPDILAPSNNRPAVIADANPIEKPQISPNTATTLIPEIRSNPEATVNPQVNITPSNQNQVATNANQDFAYAAESKAVSAPVNYVEVTNPEFTDAEIEAASAQLQQILGYVGRKQNESLELPAEIIESDVAMPMAESFGTNR